MIYFRQGLDKKTLEINFTRCVFISVHFLSFATYCAVDVGSIVIPQAAAAAAVIATELLLLPAEGGADGGGCYNSKERMRKRPGKTAGNCLWSERLHRARLASYSCSTLRSDLLPRFNSYSLEDRVTTLTSSTNIK